MASRMATQVYFTHSYAAPLIDDTAAICDTAFASPRRSSATTSPAVQFHPEKSGDVGLKILSNWLTRGRGRVDAV